MRLTFAIKTDIRNKNKHRLFVFCNSFEGFSSSIKQENGSWDEV